MNVETFILRNNSQLSTRAGTESSGGGNGGDLIVDANFIVGVLSENSDIIANAFEGAVLRTTADFTYTFESDARFRQRVSAEVNERATTVNSITSATAKIFEDIALKFSFEITKDENVASDVDEFSTQTSISLVYQFF